VTIILSVQEDLQEGSASLSGTEISKSRSDGSSSEIEDEVLMAGYSGKSERTLSLSTNYIKPNRKIEWAIDSGATHYVSNEVDALSNVKYLNNPIKMGCANKQSLIIDHIGDVTMRNPYNKELVCLTKVRYSKSCPMNLLSERRLCHNIIFLKGYADTHIRFFCCLL